MKTNCEVKIYYVDSLDSGGIKITTSGTANLSHNDQVMDDTIEMGAKWFSLDGYSTLDGTFKLAPAQKSLGEVGWWGDELSDSIGQFSTLQFIEINISGKDMKKIDVVGDTARAEYPVDFDYIVSYKGVEKWRVTVRGNIMPWFTRLLDPISLQPYDKVRLEITKWSHPGRQVKIAEMLRGLVVLFDDAIIMGIDVLEESAYDNNNFPIGTATANELTIQVHNKNRMFDTGNPDSPIKDLLQANRLVELTFIQNEKRYPMGNFWTKYFEVPEGDITARIDCYDLISRLDLRTYQTSIVKENTNLKVLATDVLTDFGLPSGMFIIDDSLAQFTIPIGYIEPMTHRAALELIIDACGGNVFVNRTGQIVLISLLNLRTDKNPKTVIGGSLHTEKDVKERNEYINVVEVWQNRLVPATAITQVLDTDVEVYAGDFLQELHFNNVPCKDVTVSITGGSANAVIAETHVYSWGVLIKGTAGAMGSFHVTAQGRDFSILKVAPVVKRVTNVEIEHRYKATDNKLRQSKEMCELYADAFLSIFSIRGKYIELTFAGNLDLELEDVFQSYTYLNKPESIANFRVIHSAISYDGGLQTKLKGRTM